MRINKFIASSSELSRRKADEAIAQDRVRVNGAAPTEGYQVTDNDIVTLDGAILKPQISRTTVLFNKPAGYVVSRDGQGSPTIYDILPSEYRELNPIGRLDKNSSGLLLLTNDGQLANDLTHPSRRKTKIYEVELDKDLTPLHHQMINDYGVQLEDGNSRLLLERMLEQNSKKWRVQMSEGRNRQIRRTFSSLGYNVVKLHRTHFGSYNLGNLKPGTTAKN